MTFLRNHRDAIAAMDFFTVPTLTFGVLYCFFVIGHDRRKILRLHITRNPTHFGSCSRCGKRGPTLCLIDVLLFDRDSKFGDDVVSFAGGWEACHCAALSGARGKTGLRSTGWEIADATYWIT